LGIPPNQSETKEAIMPKPTVATKTYIDANGSESRHASPEAVALVFAFTNGGTHRIALGDFPEDTLKAAAWHGISQKIGDSYANSKDADASAEDMFLDQLDALTRGDWLKAREVAGARTTIVAEALAALKPDKYPTVEAAQVAISAWTKDERAEKVKVPVLAAEIARIKAERAAEVASKAAEVAAGSDVTAEDL
jgi:uncharacterized small protein (DUF1192 family)